ncbi:MAG TPA: FkbM family methyltransferase [Pyrinomonadaceae bacterium]|jgi:FkbM family methyltransferase
MSLLQGAGRRVSGLLGRESRLVRGLRPAYESFLDLASGGRGIPWEINGVTYRVDPRCRRRLGHNYDAPVARFIRERLRPGALCLDVGANVGVYVLQFAHWAGVRGRVVAFEPNPCARRLLERHIRLNGLEGRVEVAPVAAGARAGEATLFAAGAAGMSRLGAPNRLIAEQVKEITVPVVTLDEFCAERGLVPDWLFLDIEGFEIAALAGARRLIESRGGSLNVVVEMHPDVWESAGTTREGAERLLGELSLRPRPLTGQADPLGEHGIVHLERARGEVAS